MKKVLNLLVFVFLFWGCGQQTVQDKPYVVVLSMDGFRWDYAAHVSTPNLDKVASKGVRAEALIPSFPTKTFPNHYSIATGLYPDNHGIVLNSFYDSELDRYFKIADRKAVEDGVFYGGEPIWVTAEKQGIRSGSYFWVGSEAEIQGVRPSLWKKYDHDFPYKQRVDSVIAWLNAPDSVRPHLVLFYFDEPDGAGHTFGPNSPELHAKIAELDFMLGYFLLELEKLSIADQVNVLVTSDHGMGPVDDSRKVALVEHLRPEWMVEIQGYNPNYNIKAAEGCIDSIYENLAHVEGISCWKADAVPPRLHYGTNDRIHDLVVVADSSWSVVMTPDDKVESGGAHGYDNANSDMHTIFYAYGPAFKENIVVPSFSNTDIYPLICEILDLQAAEVDGKLEHVQGMLKEQAGN